MDRQIAIDRITETENLTDGLEDDDANWLLNWGIAHVDGLVTGIKDEDAAGEKLNQLMAVMRTLNQIASDRAAKPAGALAADVRTFLERYQLAFGAPKAATPAPATPSPATDAKTSPTESQASKDGQDSGASPTTTPPATKAGGDQPQQTTTSGKPSKSAPGSASAKKGEAASTAPSTSPVTAPSSATPPANATKATSQASQASDQAAQAANKIAGMTPREAMQYLLSLAEAGAPAA